ncbi:doublecortin domain-containing protein 2C isoform X2 [Macrotis lagotis]|uniref:doublecortin domain-containing protein 2C isoform X2 n=1 Tax=Macrotis lagotis TaxID=92651 RepID=UPI003D6951D4
MGSQRHFSHSLLGITPSRTIFVYRNGDKFYVGKKFVINRRWVPSFEALMIQLNEKVAVPFGVRRLYTSCHGHLVQELEELQEGGRYVAAGKEGFKKLDYFHITPQKPTRMKQVKEIRPVVHSDLVVSSRWQTYCRKPCHINVFTNGNLFIPPAKLIIPRFTLYDWDNVLTMIGEKVQPLSGGVRRLYTMNGFLLDGSSDLIDHHYYVASGLETFKHLPYWEVPKIPKDIQKKYADFEKIPRRKRKVGNMRSFEIEPVEEVENMRPFEINPVEEEGSMRPFESEPVEEDIKELVDQSLYEEMLKKNESSVFYAKMEKKPSFTEPLILVGAEGYVYQAHTPRKDIQGALCVKEDKNVQIDLPIDQEREEERVYEEIDREEPILTPPSRQNKHY